MPPGPNDPRPDAAVHPHPITAGHVRIQRQNVLLGQLDGAMDVKDAGGMRRLLRAHRGELAEDAGQSLAGYEIIADCLERPGEASREAARRYYERETASTLRRYVRRHCLETEADAEGEERR